MGLEVVVGLVIAWVVGKARRAGRQLDGVADEVVDASAVRVRELVLGKLAGHSVVQRLEREAERAGEVSDGTRQRLTHALEDAVEEDPQFAGALQAAVAEAEKHGGLVATHGGTVVSGSVSASGAGSAAFGAVGSIGDNARFGQAPDPHRPGRA
jgi:hypothetical protein